MMPEESKRPIDTESLSLNGIDIRFTVEWSFSGWKKPQPFWVRALGKSLLSGVLSKEPSF
jgi:hypothetical protein